MSPVSNRLAAVTGLLLSAAAAQPAPRTSALWGSAGEGWNPTSRLPDFSFAGYHNGEQPLPSPPATASVKDFGARGDGMADDSAAFLAALTQVKSGAIDVPPGRYRITRILKIDRPNIVLRGAGSGRTFLVFPIPLNDVEPNWGATTTGQRTSNYSWSGGFVTLAGSFNSTSLARIVADARRGETMIRVNSTAELQVGQRVEIWQSDNPDNSLAVNLYSGDSGPVGNLKGRTQTSLISRITRIDGDRVHLDRSLRCDLRNAWRPEVRRFAPTVTESGVEDLSFEFPNQPYRGHFTELGFNAIALRNVADCWVRRIRTLHADSGLFITGHFNTVQDVVLESGRTPDRQDCVGHHGISVGGGDNLVTGFEFLARYIHDLTVSHHCAGNVFSRGRGVDLALDHHRYAPYENLFTDLDAGAGTRLWKCGGGADLGKHCGARGTFWNIRAAQPLTYPPAGFGPASMNLVGLRTTQPSETVPDGRWFEVIPPEDLQPPDLHAAQLRHRRAARHD